MNPVFEIRWVIGALTRPDAELINFLKGIKDFVPNFIRLDQHLLMANVGSGQLKNKFDLVREYVASPIKVGCNVDLGTISPFPTNPRFDGDTSQAVAIIKALDSAREAKLENKLLF